MFSQHWNRVQVPEGTPDRRINMIYKLVDFPSKRLIIEKYSNGFFFIATKSIADIYGKDNIFFSIEELELVIGYKLELL